MLAEQRDKPSHRGVRVEGIAEEMQGLKGQNNLKGQTAACKQVKEQENGENSAQDFRGGSWKCKAVFFVILVALTVFIMSEIYIDHRLKIKNTTKFLKNIQALKVEELANQRERSAKLKQNEQLTLFKPSNDGVQKQPQSLIANDHSKNPDQYSGKMIAGFIDAGKKEVTNNIPPTQTQASLLFKEAEDLKKQSQVSPTAKVLKQPTIQDQNIPARRPGGNNRNPSSQRTRNNNAVFGSGITQSILSQAKQRKKLVNIGLDEVNPTSIQQIKYYEQKYQISKYPQLPICVVIPTYNNANNDRYLYNIKSVVMQNYSNYHIVVIDDASTDQTGELILKFLRSQNKVGGDRYEVIRNSQQMRAMHNIRFAAKTYCKPNEIFMIVDGDDELVGRQVFKFYSAKFQADDLWFMYSNFLTVSGRAGYSRPFPQHTIAQNKYRSYPFVTSHLRAFYTQLILNIKEEDLKDEKGEYLKAANDVAICIPVLEQAHTHVEYVPEVTYFYNSNTGLNNHILRLREQRTNDKKIRLRPKYKELASLFPNQ